MIKYSVVFETKDDAAAAMAALEEASMNGDIERPFETQLIADTGDEE